MENNNNQPIREDEKLQRDSNIKPDEETLNTTDPQENMEGPVSSIANSISNAMDGGETKSEADARKDQNM